MPNQEPAFSWPFGNGPVRVGTQELFCPRLKSFVSPFNPAQLTAPGSPRMVSELLDTPVNVSLSHPTPSQTMAGYLTGQGFANVFEHLSPRDQPFGFNGVKSKLEYILNYP